MSIADTCRLIFFNMNGFTKVNSVKHLHIARLLFNHLPGQNEICIKNCHFGPKKIVKSGLEILNFY